MSLACRLLCRSLWITLRKRASSASPVDQTATALGLPLGLALAWPKAYPSPGTRIIQRPHRSQVSKSLKPSSESEHLPFKQLVHARALQREVLPLPSLEPPPGKARARVKPEAGFRDVASPCTAASQISLRVCGHVVRCGPVSDFMQVSKTLCPDPTPKTTGPGGLGSSWVIRPTARSSARRQSSKRHLWEGPLEKGFHFVASSTLAPCAV